MPDNFKLCVAISWYSPEAWRELEAIPEAKIKMSYKKFVHKVERVIAEIQDLEVVKFDINIAQMIEWCRRNGYR
jgi:hypothetical protein